ncbi:hypothetical protein [Tatumella terrea]|uniref:hypothetical protein n=1 Tax=Tatumella terrea TaxID=419007 RepID=UPI0031D3AE08
MTDGRQGLAVVPASNDCAAYYGKLCSLTSDKLAWPDGTYSGSPGEMADRSDKSVAGIDKA